MSVMAIQNFGLQSEIIRPRDLINKINNSMIKRCRLLWIYGLYFRGSSTLGDVKSGRWLFTFRRTVIIGISEEPSACSLRLHI